MFKSMKYRINSKDFWKNTNACNSKSRNNPICFNQITLQCACKRPICRPRLFVVPFIVGNAMIIGRGSAYASRCDSRRAIIRWRRYWAENLC